MTSQNKLKQVQTYHKDLIQDIAFDFHGKRVATASLDQTVKIWNINENNEWVFKEEIKVSKTIFVQFTQIFIFRLIPDKSGGL